MAQNVEQPVFVKINAQLLPWKTVAQKVRSTSAIFKKTTQSKQSPNRRKIAESGHHGVDVMITIFCHFRQFWAKKLAFFSKTDVMIKIFCYFRQFSAKKLAFFSKTDVMIKICIV
jgi:hypothetical protein